MQKGRGSDKEIFQKVFFKKFFLKNIFKKYIKIPFLDSCDLLIVSRGSRKGGGRGSGRRKRKREEEEEDERIK